MKIAIVVFPGTNCEQDIAHVFGELLGQSLQVVWHRDGSLGAVDAVVLPGGFSYGDYLRTGALAKISPLMNSVREFAARGGPVLGVCNGFQVLCEAGLLPGALMVNRGMRFISTFVDLVVERCDTPFTSAFTQHSRHRWPVAHFEGCYYAPHEQIARLEGEGQVVFRYCSPEGRVDPEDPRSNPNGSVVSIAGICNSTRNVVGLMPHPERAVEDLVGFVGAASGRLLFESLLR